MLENRKDNGRMRTVRKASIILWIFGLLMVGLTNGAVANSSDWESVPRENVPPQLDRLGGEGIDLYEYGWDEVVEDGSHKEDVAGGQQITFRIDSPVESHKKEFDLNLKDGMEIRQIEGYYFVFQHGDPVIRISAPWARDVNGNPVDTWFTSDGKTLTQHVSHVSEGQYPIVADPRWTWGNISGHVYFSKEETRRLAATSAGAAAVGPFWAAIPPPFGYAIMGWWEKNSIAVTETALRAVEGDKCVELKFGWIGVAGGAIGVSPAEYSEGCA